MERLDCTYKDEACEPLAMSAAELLPELLPKWSSPDGIAMPTRNKTDPSEGPSFRSGSTEKATWHSRTSNLVSFNLLLGIGAIFAVVVTARYMANPDVIGLSSLVTNSTGLSSLVTNSTGLSSLVTNSTGLSSLVTNSTGLSSLVTNSTGLSSLVTNSTGLSSLVTNSTGLSSLVPNSTASGHNRDTPSSEELSKMGLMPYPVDLSDLSDLYHDMSDAELLRVATVDGARLRRGERVSPKVAYMFLMRGSLPLAPLWERYFKGHEDLYSIYIHSHPNFLPNFRPDSVFYRRNIPSKEVARGQISLLAAERRLLANALLDAAIEHFVLVSESCIPLTPFPVAYQYIVESEYSFVDCFVDFGGTGNGRYERIKNHDKLNPEISIEQWRKGSEWFVMSSELALLLVADSKYYVKFESLFCKDDYLCFSDEHYIPTVLAILAPSKLANRTTTYVQFRGSKDGHPYQWRVPDVTELRLRNIKTGQNCTYNGRMTDTCYLFARKFGPGTIEPLLEIATASFGIP